MKMFAPNQLIQAVMKVKRDHPIKGETTKALPTQFLKELVLTIDRKDKAELKEFSVLLTARQRNALCMYLENNIYRVDLRKIEYVIELGMNASCYSTLFWVWNKNPHCTNVLQLLGQYDQAEIRPEKFPVKQGLLSAWLGASKCFLAIVRTCNDIGIGNTFGERFASVGLIPDSALYFLCEKIFLAIADRSQFRQEGDKHIAALLGRVHQRDQTMILVHLLHCCADSLNTLIDFPMTYQYAYMLWKEPGKGLFPRENQDVRWVYTWWYNYELLRQMFRNDSDKSRIEFWKQYLHLCSCRHTSKHAMLIMDFGAYIVSEFENIGAVYIFERNYFLNVVQTNIKHKKTVELKSWLYNHAKYESRETHQYDWQHKLLYVLRKYGIGI